MMPQIQFPFVTTVLAAISTFLRRPSLDHTLLHRVFFQTRRKPLLLGHATLAVYVEDQQRLRHAPAHAERALEIKPRPQPRIPTACAVATRRPNNRGILRMHERGVVHVYHEVRPALRSRPHHPTLRTQVRVRLVQNREPFGHRLYASP
ncbi:hypothetical protein QJS04_geneDACA019509 [Acorus gramineus]|uniref:Secreted protein n=1 Tax=Acorus gramineus TaxID=55184 RepID=A0AAV9AB30_ACOGR|nr:hypothetical protein QJS04_geneDACA019509 [Acorus gramineus]